MTEGERHAHAATWFWTGATCVGLTWLFVADYPHSWNFLTSPVILMIYGGGAIWLILKRLLSPPKRVHQPRPGVGVQTVELNSSNWGSVWKRLPRRRG